MKTLILTEKPSVARDFAKALQITTKTSSSFEDDSTIITWAIGHLLIPKDPHEYDGKWKRWKLDSLPIVPGKFSLKPAPKTSSQLYAVIKHLKRRDISRVIVATDAGREGELIARSLLNFAAQTQKPQYQAFRFWTSEALSPSVIDHGLKNLLPLEEFDGLFAAGRARQCADWLVGMNLTRLMTLQLGDLFSVGRVQTAVLALLVKRHEEREKFCSDTYFNLYASFEKKSWKARYLSEKLAPDHALPSLEKAQSIELECREDQFKVTALEVKKTPRPTPMLYSLTDLQRAANQAFGLSAAQTLKIAQGLYEKYKCLSYPRTDAKVLGNKTYPLVVEIREKFKKVRPELFVNVDEQKLRPNFGKVFNSQKLTDHHALIPLKPVNLKPGSAEEKVFNLVVTRFFQVFAQDALFENTRIDLCTEKSGHHFRADFENCLFEGWMALGKTTSTSKLSIPQISQGDLLQTQDFEILEKQTKPPELYNDASLLKEMTNPSRLVTDKEHQKIFRGEVGLGTQATRAQLIETLIDRQYIKREKRHFIVMPKGVKLIQSLQKKTFSSALTQVEQTAIWEMNLSLMSDKAASPQKFLSGIHQLIVKVIEEWREEVPLEKSAQSKQHSGYLKASRQTSVALGSCPLCHKGEVKLNQKAYFCSQWKEGCPLTLWKKIAGKSLTPSNVKALLTKGETSKLKGFRSKGGKRFSAAMKLQDGKVELVF